MQVFLVRHAEAQTQAETDAARELTDCGHVQAQAAASWLAEQCQGLQVRVLASPYVRAQMTAWHVANALQTAVTSVDELTPDHDPLRAEHALSLYAQAEVEALVVISHMPLIASLQAWLRDAELTSGEAFDLAEVRRLSFEVLAAGLGQDAGGFLPEAPTQSLDVRSLITRLKNDLTGEKGGCS